MRYIVKVIEPAQDGYVTFGLVEPTSTPTPGDFIETKSQDIPVLLKVLAIATANRIGRSSANA